MDAHLRENGFHKSATCDSTSMSLIIGLEGLKERCFKNQKIIDKLQDENRRLLSNQRRYQSEISKISGDNESLRRTTEELNEALLDRSAQIEELQTKYDDLSQKSISVNDPSLSWSDSSRVDEQEQSDSESLTFEEIIDEFLMQSRSEELKSCLIDQQNLLLNMIEKFRTSSTDTDIHTETEIQDEIYRTCPMCEVGFALHNFNQEAFERHVLEHFQSGDEEEMRTMTQDQFQFVEN